MSIPFGRLLAACLLLVFLAAVACGQSQAASAFKIELKSDDPILVGYSCYLEEYATRRRFGVEDVRPDGACTFRETPYGDYRLIITDSRNTAVYEDLVTVSQYGPSTSIRLPEHPLPPGGPVSLNRLQHPPTRQAYSAMRSAQRFSQAGDYRRAAGELQKAVNLSPDFADAHWNLAVQYIRLGELQQSVDESRRGMQLEKPGAPQLCNLAYAQLQLKQYAEAIQSATASLRVEPDYAQAHFVLGVILAQRRETLSDGISHLERAARSLPAAGEVLEMARRAQANPNARNAQ